MNDKIASNFRYKAASTVLNLAQRTLDSGLERNSSAHPKEGWVKGGMGQYCLPEKIYEALQYYEIANEIHPSSFTLNHIAMYLEILLDFPAALEAYMRMEEWLRANETGNSVYLQAAHRGQARCQGKPKGNLPGIANFAENLVFIVSPTSDTQNEEAAIDKVAIDFVDALIQRDYSLAYSMTTQDFQKRTPLSKLKQQFEHSCPPDYGEFDMPDILTTMDEWPSKSPNDIRWIYITIGGATNEAVNVVVAREVDELKISEVDVGRP